VVTAYSDEWPRLFEAEREILEHVLAPWLSGGIHHVGSTAVPGLAAKPTIDMIAGVANLDEAWAACEPLATLGYVYGEHRPEAHWFRKPGDAAWWEGTHGLHLTEPGSELWRERLAFRDALRADRELAAEYEQWKFSHAAAKGEPTAYRANKNPFVTRVLRQFGIHLKPDGQRLTPKALARRQR
jgi:GrpB-like predicted nucleotidyltransferase (UPF0157 family)